MPALCVRDVQSARKRQNIGFIYTAAGCLRDSLEYFGPWPMGRGPRAAFPAPPWMFTNAGSAATT